MASKASGQVTVVDVTDAYSVILTSEVYTFIGNTTGAPSGLSCTTQVVAYCGTQQCTNVDVSTVTCPTGISATISDNNTVSPTITFKTTATITEACEATIPVVVDGVTINKTFSFAVAKQGDAGVDGIGIESTTITYQIASSGTSAPTGTWSESVPKTDESNPYLWTKTVITYTDGTTSTSYSVSSTLDGVSVGGRNLILETKTMKTWTLGSKLAVTYSVADERGGTDAVKIINSKGTVGDAYFNRPFQSNISLESSTYTLSFWAKSDASTGSTIQVNSDGFATVKTISINDTWERYVYSFTTNKVYTGTEVLWFNILGTSPVYMAHSKLELGNIATDWSPAPEDVENNVTSKIEQLKDSITLSVTDGSVGNTAKIKLEIDDETKEASIDLTGAVSFSDLSTAGKTTINGSNITTGELSADLITTGTLSADRIDTAALFANDITASGKIQFNNGLYKLLIDETEKTITLSSWSELMLQGVPVKIYSSGGYITLSSMYDITLQTGTNGVVRIPGTCDLSAPRLVDSAESTSTITASYAEKAKTSTSYFACWDDYHISNIKSADAATAMGITYGSWTPSFFNLTGTTYTKQYGWYMRVGNIVTIGWYIYATNTTADNTSKGYGVHGLPSSCAPMYRASGGGEVSGYYSENQVNFSGWELDTNGRIYAIGTTNGSAVIKWAERNIYHAASDTAASGTIVYLSY